MVSKPFDILVMKKKDNLEQAKRQNSFTNLKSNKQKTQKCEWKKKPKIMSKYLCIQINRP